eukprot:scaffold107474_cov21-Phaeocystis_antarctica.AAC.1
MAAAMVVVAMAAAAMAAVTVEAAKVVATAADRTPRPHSSARRAKLIAFPPAEQAEGATVVAGRVAATVEARAAVARAAVARAE